MTAEIPPDAAPEAASDAKPGDDHLADARAAGRERRIRSFVIRAGRLSNGQRRALEEFGPRYLIPFAERVLDWHQAFGRDGKRILEIGFGMGGSTAEIARRRPQDNFLGCEVHEPGVGALLKLIAENDLHNLRIIRHDAVEVLQTMIEAQSLDGVHIFFPDPWHKARHHKRRLIQPPLLALLASRLAPGGYIHCATDWEPYAQQMLEVLNAEATLENTSGGFCDRPDYRPVTKFEQRGLKLGHGVWDLLFRKRA